MKIRIHLNPEREETGIPWRAIINGRQPIIAREFKFTDVPKVYTEEENGAFYICLEVEETKLAENNPPIQERSNS